MFKKLFRKLAGIKDFLTNEIGYLKFNDSESKYEPKYVSDDYNWENKMSYIFINESERLIKIFMDSEMDSLQRELGASHGKKRVFETDAFLHPTELLRILHKGSVDGNTAYVVEFQGRSDDRVVVQGKNIIHMSEWDSSINQHRKIRQFTGSNVKF
ncbi:MAG: hypothetical protein WD512_02770 [Candidatus Paceibacterota bacterium]